MVRLSGIADSAVMITMTLDEITFWGAIAYYVALSLLIVVTFLNFKKEQNERNNLDL